MIFERGHCQGLIKNIPELICHPLLSIFGFEHTITGGRQYVASFCQSTEEKFLQYVFGGVRLCMLHIIEDPSGPYKKCDFIAVVDRDADLQCPLVLQTPGSFLHLYSYFQFMALIHLVMWSILVVSYSNIVLLFCFVLVLC